MTDPRDVREDDPLTLTHPTYCPNCGSVNLKGYGAMQRVRELIDRLKTLEYIGNLDLAGDAVDHKGEAVAWAYQFAGARGACVEALDNLSDVAQGLPPRHEWPVTGPAIAQNDAALTPKPDAPPVPYGQGSGPLPGKNVTVVQTGDKTLFITAPAAPPAVKDCPTAPPLTDGRLREVAERLRIEIQYHWQEWQDSNAYPDPMEAFLLAALREVRDRCKPDAPPNPAAEPEPINYPRAVAHLSDRIETLEGALRRADDRLAAIHHAHEFVERGGNPMRFAILMGGLPTLIQEGEKALREEEGS